MQEPLAYATVALALGYLAWRRFFAPRRARCSNCAPAPAPAPARRRGLPIVP
ncbi:MAG: hypothetical protein K1X88_21380 [Nannocystaceae bacterium]|nr:hypothetical protein [Nannocystaceae bacterium]